MTQLWSDSLIAMRQLARSWRIVVVTGLTIALAVAATATTLTVFNAVLLRPLPFPQPDQLYRVLPINARGESISVSVPTLRDWQERLRGVTLAGHTILDFTCWAMALHNRSWQHGSRPRPHSSRRARLRASTRR
jgi:putative ABC transport system permease protein